MELSKLTKKRSVVRKAVTKTCNEIKDILVDINNPEELQAGDWSRTKGLLIFLKEKELLLKDLDIKIEDLTPLDDYEAECESVTKYEENITTTIGHAEAFLILKETSKSDTSTVSTNSETSSANSKLIKTMKLPVLEFPKFDGNLTKWTTWWERFRASVHENDSLTVIDKYNYLRALVTGTAESAIVGLPVTESNYAAAIDRLQKRFGKTQAVIHAHLLKLLSLDPLKTGSLNEIRKLQDEVLNNISALEALGVSRDAYGQMLFAKLRELLTSEMLKDFRLSGKDCTLEELLSFISSEVEAKEEESCRVERKTNIGPPSSLHKSKTLKPTSTLAALSTEVESRKMYCIFCTSNQHWTEECDQEMDITERKKILSKKGRCFKCLRSKHLAKDCKVRNLECSKCKGRHHSLVCEPKKENLTCKTDMAVVHLSQSLESTTETGTSLLLLQTASVRMESANVQLLGRCLLDGGSMRTFVLKQTSLSMELPVIGYEKITVHAFGGQTQTELCRKVQLQLNSLHDKQKIVIEALEVNSICANVLSLPTKVVKDLLLDKGLKMADPPRRFTRPEQGEIQVLIGVDYYGAVVKPEVLRMTDKLIATNTIFGWVISGPVRNDQQCLLSDVTTMCAVMNVSMEQCNPSVANDSLEKFWKLEHLGIVENEKSNNCVLPSPDWKDGRFEVSLPWLDGKRQHLADNYVVARKRLGQLLKKLKKTPDILNQYDQVLQEYLKEGIIEQVTDLDSRPSYFLPHRAVVKEERKTTKLRIVFDASSHAVGESSLNQCLWSGPDLLNDLFDLLFLFRKNPIAVTADIEKAFLQIGLKIEDRDAVCFLWTKELDNNDPPIYRFARVLFGVTSSPALLNSTLKFLFESQSEKFPDTCKILTDSLYVDDLITSVKTPEDACQLRTETDETLSKGSFTMRKWRCNNPTVQMDWLKKEPTIELDEEQKVLGLIWRPQDDTLSVAPLSSNNANLPLTKRRILETASKVFDPLGFLAPLTVRFKILLQELWKAKLLWDEPVPSSIETVWKGWITEIDAITELQIPRWIGYTVDQMKGELHVFVDASERAYAAVAFLRLISKGSMSISWVACKTRVAPIKTLTLPRLELMAAVLGARLCRSILEKMQEVVYQVVLWTDSNIVLNWIKGSPYKWKPFVRNRVTEIQELTNKDDWKHCPGKWNPADLPSRGSPLRDVETWWRGPEWLIYSENWPSEIVSSKTAESLEVVELLIHDSTQGVNPSDNLIDSNRFSSYQRLVRIAALVLKAVKCFKGIPNLSNTLTATEMKEGENLLIKEAQRRTFAIEISGLTKGQAIDKKSPLSCFSCWIDENGLLRIRGRLMHSEVEKFNSPIVLPAKDRFTYLLVNDTHIRLHHAGTLTTLMELREQFWPLRGRQVVKKCIARCFRCKLLTKPLEQTPTGSLPRERSTFQPAFETTGVDFAGPLLAKSGQGEIKKAYVALFTCAVTRAVHLELVSDLSTDSFLLCFRRFISRRGICKVVYSDNALTFKRADKELQALLNHFHSCKTKELFSSLRISWHFIVERAPWWGGFWERMVRSVKDSLKKTVGKNLLTMEELVTVLSEIEAVINSRPLSPMADDIHELMPLTPAHFLTGQRLTLLPTPISLDFPPQTRTIGELRKRWKIREQTLDNLANRWRNEYIQLLKSAHVNNNKQGTELKAGDLILLSKEKCPRHRWPLGRLLDLHAGRDGHHRSGTIKLIDGSVVRRPISLMVPLEIP